MKITDKTTAPTFPTIQLNNVPIHQVFRGRIQTKSGPLAGLFFKAHTGSAIRGVDDGITSLKTADVVVVKLDEPYSVPGKANIILDCYPVHDYEPLEVELVLTKGGGK